MNFSDIFHLFMRIKLWFGTKTTVFFASLNKKTETYDSVSILSEAFLGMPDSFLYRVFF